MTVTGPVMTLQVRDRDEVLEPYRVSRSDPNLPTRQDAGAEVY
jgi:hypothetical protein